MKMSNLNSFLFCWNKKHLISLALKKLYPYFFSIKGTFVVISFDPPFKETYVWFPTVPFKPSFRTGSISYKIYLMRDIKFCFYHLTSYKGTVDVFLRDPSFLKCLFRLITINSKPFLIKNVWGILNFLVTTEFFFKSSPGSHENKCC